MKIIFDSQCQKDFKQVVRHYPHIKDEMRGLSEAALDPFYVRFPVLLLLADILTRGKVDKNELMKMVDRVIIPRLPTL